MTSSRLGPEFSLLVRCCRWNFAQACEQPRPEIPMGLEWNRFVGLARQHRVQGLAWNALAQHADQLSEQAKGALSSDAMSTAATNLGIAAECCELVDSFAGAGVDLLFVKGLSVAALAYRSPMLKMGWDIDLLINQGDLAAAAEQLFRRDYELVLPSGLDLLAPWHQRSKESVWRRENGIHVELHTRLADNSQLIPSIGMQSPRQMVEVMPGVALPTLARDELFAYLAVHGASSAWFRLKWISDFAALLAGLQPDEIRHLYQCSQAQGAGRAAGQALLLSDALFDGLEDVPDLRASLSSDAMTRRLCQAALRLLAECDQEPTEKPLGTWTIHWTQHFLLPGPAYPLSEFSRQARSLVTRFLG